jgi:hypothetical protein
VTCGALVTRSRVRRLTGSPEAARTGLDEAMQAIDASGAKAWQPFVHLEQAELARLEGDDARGRRELELALGHFEAAGATGHAARTRDLLHA